MGSSCEKLSKTVHNGLSNTCICATSPIRKLIIHLKLSFEKAFDKVNNKEMFSIIQHNDFEEQWLHWVAKIILPLGPDLFYSLGCPVRLSIPGEEYGRVIFYQNFFLTGKKTSSGPWLFYWLPTIHIAVSHFPL